MSEPFLGQIITTGFGFAPRTYALCNGQLIPVRQNAALFALLGVQYGGDGTQTFALPDMRGRYPLGAGPSVDPAWQPPVANQGSPQGVESVTLLESQIPPHTHLMGVTSAAAANGAPSNEIFATASANAYAPAGNLTPLGGGPLTPTGGLPHDNMQPSLVISFSIALSGIFPSRQ
ncbi:tail fiber protein [Brevundimonas sp.]|uniref:phage tail protein n=1 Tax=Brevundimonas sp. TaxID=1871086 RepID=UPI002896E028|nr:tail fiber protein [Brevundimonas sp.]